LAKKSPHPTKLTLEELQKRADELAKNSVALSPYAAAAARKEIVSIVEQLERVRVALDPIREPESLFDPSNPRVVGKFGGIALVAQDRHPIDAVPRFYGSGVYALYYAGSFQPYAPIVGTETPIYVGKADPEDANAKTSRAQGDKLYGRLREHLRSIRKASSSLAVGDFTARYLVIQTGQQVSAEAYLINLFKPVWNDECRICYGIGKHGDRADKRSNDRSPWDTLHPGREWAANAILVDAKPTAQIVAELQAHYKLHPPFKTIDEVLKQFYEDLKQR
jgi:hypothetical protein